MPTIVDLIERESGYHLRKKTAQEMTGACPFCRAGDDRLQVWPEENRYWCRQCDRKGDAIQFVRDYKKMGFAESKTYLAKNGYQIIDTADTRDTRHTVDTLDTHLLPHAKTEAANPPDGLWVDRAWQFVFDCQAHLMERGTNPKALEWLHGRRLTDKTLWAVGMGYNPTDQYIERDAWGLPPATNDKGRPKQLWLPRGIVIPWVIDGDLWGLSIRRPVGEPKYYWLPGGTPALYRADSLTGALPAVLVEGEIDALTIAQEAGDLATPVATGSTGRGRSVRWLARLALPPAVLVAYDADEAGEKASGYWLDVIKNAKRWRPYWGDANGLAQAGVAVRRWIEAGVTHEKANIRSHAADGTLRTAERDS